MKSGYVVAIGMVVAILVVGTVSYLRQANDREPITQNRSENSQSTEVDDSSNSQPTTSLDKILNVNESDMVEVGGVLRPKRDIAFEEPVEQEAERTFVNRPSAGSAPEVPKDTNPEVSKLYEELEQDKDKGVLAAKSSLFEPEKFDAKAYEADPQNWLSQIRPGRVFQPAQPGSDVAPIKTKSKVFNSILQGEKVVLEAKVEPNAPVSFYVPGVGVLDNQLTTQTIAADENGIARTTFTATKGTKGLVDIMAASPLHSGQLRYRVHVSLPNN